MELRYNVRPSTARQFAPYIREEERLELDALSGRKLSEDEFENRVMDAAAEATFSYAGWQGGRPMFLGGFTRSPLTRERALVWLLPTVYAKEAPVAYTRVIRAILDEHLGTDFVVVGNALPASDTSTLRWLEKRMGFETAGIIKVQDQDWVRFFKVAE